MDIHWKAQMRITEYSDKSDKLYLKHSIDFDPPHPQPLSRVGARGADLATVLYQTSFVK